MSMLMFINPLSSLRRLGLATILPVLRLRSIGRLLPAGSGSKRKSNSITM
jgi:hypothetical protein